MEGLGRGELAGIVAGCAVEILDRHASGGRCTPGHGSGTGVLNESRADKLAQDFLKSRGYDDYAERMRIIGTFKHAVPNLRLDDDKFVAGALRLYIDEGSLSGAQEQSELDRALKYIHMGKHTAEFDENLNGLSLDELTEMFREAAAVMSDEDRARSASREFAGRFGYKVIPINGYNEASRYGRYTKWCVTHDEGSFKGYARCGSRFYFCLRDGFQTVPDDDAGAPLNDYGLSMISVLVDMDGELLRITTRYNHDFNGENNPGLETPGQLEDVIDLPFYETFRPYTEDELMEMGIVPFGRVQAMLDDGADPDEIFETVGGETDGVRAVGLNDMMNYLKGRRLMFDKWMDMCYDFSGGFGIVERRDGLFNYARPDGTFLMDEWMTWCYDFSEGFGAVRRAGDLLWNYVRPDGTFLLDEWMRWCGRFGGGFGTVQYKAYMCNYVRPDGTFLLDRWCYSCDLFGVYVKIGRVQLTAEDRSPRYVSTRGRIFDTEDEAAADSLRADESLSYPVRGMVNGSAVPFARRAVDGRAEGAMTRAALAGLVAECAAEIAARASAGDGDGFTAMVRATCAEVLSSGKAPASVRMNRYAMALAGIPASGGVFDGLTVSAVEDAGELDSPFPIVVFLDRHGHTAGHYTYTRYCSDPGLRKARGKARGGCFPWHSPDPSPSGQARGGGSVEDEYRRRQMEDGAWGTEYL